MTERRLEPYRDAGVLEFMREIAARCDLELPARPWRDFYTSEDSFELYTREFGSATRGVRLEGRSGIDPRSSHVNQERTKAVLYGFENLSFELETVDGVFQGSYATLRLEADPALESELLAMFVSRFSR